MIKTSAPGSTVLLGEHAVLHGAPAVGCAVDHRIYVTLSPRQDRQIVIHSTLGNYKGYLDALPDSNIHKFSVYILRQWHQKLPYGLDLTIHSDFSHTLGLGSSAALTVSLIAGIHQLINHEINHKKILKEARAVIQSVQGRGSGLDIATSTFGGIIQYSMPSLEVIPLTSNLPLTLFYSGYKKTTPEVLEKVAGHTEEAPHLYQQLYRLMGACTEEAIIAIKKNNLSQLGLCMNYYHGLMDTLGVCDKTLANMTYTLRDQPSVYGVKISGSGLGDCIITLGETAPDVLADHRITINISSIGVRLESSAS